MEHLHSVREEMITSSACGDYRVTICWPDGAPPNDGWPVIYILDGAHHFPVAATLMRTLGRPRCCMVPGVIVAIDYPEETRRDRDYRPYVAELIPEPDPRGGVYPAGGEGCAEAFLAFIRHELKPMIRNMLPIDNHREALFGHSYGGLFTLNTLFTQAESFRHYYASSPSVWWNGSYIVKSAQRFIQQSAIRSVPPERVLFLSVGEHEQSLEEWELSLPADTRQYLVEHRWQRRMVDGVRELASLLQVGHISALQVELFIHQGQSHQSVPLCSLQKAMMHHFKRG